jgi:hypothetical protein
MVMQLTNATGTWSRPGGGTSGAVAKVWGIVIDDADTAPARPPLIATPATNVSNPTGASGSWSFAGLMGAAVNDFKKLVVWLDIETEACYERDEVVFRGDQAGGPVPPPPGPQPAAAAAPANQPPADGGKKRNG